MYLRRNRKEKEKNTNFVLFKSIYRKIKNVSLEFTYKNDKKSLLFFEFLLKKKKKKTNKIFHNDLNFIWEKLKISLLIVLKFIKSNKSFIYNLLTKRKKIQLNSFAFVLFVTNLFIEIRIFIDKKKYNSYQFHYKRDFVL